MWWGEQIQMLQRDTANDVMFVSWSLVYKRDWVCRRQAHHKAVTIWSWPEFNPDFVRSAGRHVPLSRPAPDKFSLAYMFIERDHLRDFLSQSIRSRCQDDTSQAFYLVILRKPVPQMGFRGPQRRPRPSAAQLCCSPSPDTPSPPSAVECSPRSKPGDWRRRWRPHGASFHQRDQRMGPYTHTHTHDITWFQITCLTDD